MEPSSCSDASQKQKRKQLYNHQEVLALLKNLDSDNRSYYEDSDSEFDVVYLNLNRTTKTAIDLDLSPDRLVDLDRKLISHLKVRKRRQPVKKPPPPPPPPPEGKGKATAVNLEKQRARLDLDPERDRLRKQILMS